MRERRNVGQIADLEYSLRLTSGTIIQIVVLLVVLLVPQFSLVSALIGAAISIHSPLYRRARCVLLETLLDE